MSALRLSVLFVLALALGVPGIAAAKRKPPPPPPPPADSAADCTFVVEPSIDDYIVLATLLVGVRCETSKQRIDTSIAEFTRDGVSLLLLPVGSDRRTCLNASVCFLGIDLFSYDNHPVAFPGDQLYCASGSGGVGGRVVGPGSGCEHDARI